MPDTFNFVPTYSTEASPDQKATIVAFGDAYEQRTPIGLNADRLSLRVVFQSVTTAKAAAIIAFLRAHGNTQAFLWTPPAPYGNNGPIQFIARLPATHTFNGYNDETVQVTFDQDFNPL